MHCVQSLLHHYDIIICGILLKLKALYLNLLSLQTIKEGKGTLLKQQLLEVHGQLKDSTFKTHKCQFLTDV